MPTQKVDLDACPGESCDADVSYAAKTTDPIKLTTKNMTQDRTCIEPTTLAGEPATLVIFHDEIGPTPEPDIPVDDDQGDEPEPEDETEEDPREHLGTDATTIFRRIMENEPISQSTLCGKSLKDDLSPTETKGIVDALLSGGHIEETDDGKYVTAG